MASKSAAFAPQTGFALHTWLFYRGNYTLQCMCKPRFPHKANILPSLDCPPGIISGAVMEHWYTCDVNGKWYISTTVYHTVLRLLC